MHCRSHTISALSALDYLNLDPYSVSTVMRGDLFSLLDEEKVKRFVEHVHGRCSWKTLLMCLASDRSVGLVESKRYGWAVV